jgi:hypothetical protein
MREGDFGKIMDSKIMENRTTGNRMLLCLPPSRVALWRTSRQIRRGGKNDFAIHDFVIILGCGSAAPGIHRDRID